MNSYERSEYDGFIGADISGTDFRDADMRECNFAGADLRGADFRGATLDEDALRGVDVVEDLRCELAEVQRDLDDEIEECIRLRARIQELEAK